MDVAMLLVSIICLMVPYNCLGAFSFDNITENNGRFCEASNMTLSWNYSTDETVTVIEWYKQPGVLIARIFGVSVGAPFTVLAPYNAPPYTVTQYQTSKYNAAIQISNVSTSDTGVYSVNVTAASPKSDILYKEIIPISTDKPNVTCNPRTCTPPVSAVDVTTVWTQNGNTHRCTLQGGSADCASDAVFDECTSGFSFDNITNNNGRCCEASNMTLSWSYSTDETVTVIEWYKQPGVLIARIFGVNVGAPFTVLAPYNAPPYTVTQYQTSKYNAAIQISNVSSSDSGVYSVNVTAASPQSATLTKEIIPISTDKPNVTCNPKTCTPPVSAVDVTTVWTQNGNTHRCTLQGGSADCASDAVFDECTSGFSFDNITKNNGQFCEAENMTLLWSYSTDETVTVIEWYKQPGVLIARIFGVNVGASFTVLAPYNAPPYTVTQYQTSKYNAAIQISNVSSSDSGVYSVNVTAASPQSATLIKEIIPISTDKPNVNCNPKTCTPPVSAVDVTTKWTQNGNTHRCTLQGGSADCASDAVFYECTIGSISFDDITGNNEVFCDASNGLCSGTTKLLWNYVTDETVTIIEWHKQPGILIARLAGASFEVNPPYNATPYNVTRYKTTKYNAAIQIRGLSASDAGVYSVNVTASMSQSATLIRRIAASIPADEKPIVNCNQNTCTPPASAVDVTTVWTKHGDANRCTLQHGNAACSCDAIYAECRDESNCYYCLLAWLILLAVPLVQLVLLLVIKLKEVARVGIICFVYHLLLVLPLFGWLSLIPSLWKRGKFNMKKLDYNLGDKVMINVSTTFGVVIILLLQFFPWSDDCKAAIKFGIFVLVALVCCGFATLFMLLRYFRGCEECGDLKTFCKHEQTKHQRKVGKVSPFPANVEDKTSKTQSSIQALASITDHNKRNISLSPIATETRSYHGADQFTFMNKEKTENKNTYEQEQEMSTPRKKRKKKKQKPGETKNIETQNWTFDYDQHMRNLSIQPLGTEIRSDTGEIVPVTVNIEYPQQIMIDEDAVEQDNQKRSKPRKKRKRRKKNQRPENAEHNDESGVKTAEEL